MRPLLALLLLLSLGAARAEEPARLRTIAAEGGDLRLELEDGAVLRAADLAGARLRFDGLELRLDEVRRDAAVPDGRPGGFAPDIWLFRLLAREPGAEWAEFCVPDAAGERLAMVLPTEPGGFAFTCSSGGSGRCIRMGYRPWAELPDGRSLAPYHAACVHLLRAAYGGDERAFARDGAALDVYDRIGIRPAAADPGLAFEAGWSAEGAVCVAHPRLPEAGNLSEILRHVPRLIGRAGAEGCDEVRAAAYGALLFNRSRPPQ